MATTAGGTPVMSGRRVAVVFAGILLGATLSGLDASIVATAAPTVIAELGQLSLLPWLTTSYLLAQVATMAVFGKLGDIHGRRRVFAIALIVFMIGSVLCGLSTSMPMLIGSRVLQGVGAGGITGLAMALVADLVPADRLGRYLGYTGLVFAGTSVMGPFAGGLFVDNLSWRWAFFVNIPSGLLCLVALAFQPEQARRVAHRIDVAGALLLAASVGALLLALTRGETTGWGAPSTVVLLLGSVVTGGLFVLRQRVAVEPLLPLRILGNRVSSLSTLANLVAGFGFTIGIIYPPLFFQAVGGVQAAESGLLLAPFAFTTAMATLVAGQVTDRVGGHKMVPLIGMGFLTAGYALLGTIEASTSVVTVTGFAMVAGVGVGLVMQTLLFVVQRATPADDMGVATSTVMLARVLGSAIGVAVVGGVFTSRLAEEVTVRLPGFPASEIQGDPQRVAALADAARVQLQDAFAAALAGSFRVAVPVMLFGMVVVAFIPAARVVALLRDRSVVVSGPEPAETLESRLPPVP